MSVLQNAMRLALDVGDGKFWHLWHIMTEEVNRGLEEYICTLVLRRLPQAVGVSD